MESLADVGLSTVKRFKLLEEVKQLEPATNQLQEWPANLFIAQFDRFELWAVNLGLFVMGHGSLDYRIRDSESMRESIYMMIQNLNRSLDEVLDYVNGNTGQEDEDSDTDSEPESDMDLLLGSVRDPIDRLYKLAVWIRNPATRLTSSKARNFKQIDPETNIDLFESYENYDYSYVSSLFLEYEKHKALQENTAVECKNKDPVSGDGEADNNDDVWEPIRRVLELNKEKMSNGTESYLVRRIARANGRRRQQFAYWKRHKDKLRQHASTVVEAPERQLLNTGHVISGHIEEAKTPLSVTTATQLRLAQAAGKELLEKEGVLKLDVSEYAPSAWNPSKDTVSFPPPPKITTSDNFFECPYCFTICPISLLSEKAWRAHIIRDLRPYVCTYEQCLNSEQLYDTRDDWIQHEISTHQRIFRCFDHEEEVFATLEAYEEHVEDHHKDEAASSKMAISAIKNFNRSCPVCSIVLGSVQKLQSHIALHLERFAMFSLPRHADNNEQSETESQSNNARLDSHSFSTSPSVLESYIIKNLNAKQQAEEGFKKLKQLEEQGALSDDPEFIKASQLFEKIQERDYTQHTPEQFVQDQQEYIQATKWIKVSQLFYKSLGQENTQLTPEQFIREQQEYTQAVLEMQQTASQAVTSENLEQIEVPLVSAEDNGSDEDEEAQQCAVRGCGKTFASSKYLSLHQFAYHPGLYKGKWICGLCHRSDSLAEKSFTHADDFQRHLRTAHAFYDDLEDCSEIQQEDSAESSSWISSNDALEQWLDNKAEVTHNAEFTYNRRLQHEKTNARKTLSRILQLIRRESYLPNQDEREEIKSQLKASVREVESWATSENANELLLILFKFGEACNDVGLITEAIEMLELLKSLQSNLLGDDPVLLETEKQLSLAYQRRAMLLSQTRVTVQDQQKEAPQDGNTHFDSGIKFDSELEHDIKPDAKSSTSAHLQDPDQSLERQPQIIVSQPGPSIALQSASREVLPFYRRQNPDFSLPDPFTPATLGSVASESNSLQLPREESVVLPERFEDESPAKYIARIEGMIGRGGVAAELSKGTDPFSTAALRSFMKTFSFFGDYLNMAIRKLLTEVELPKETQQIDRFLQAFANRYHECNPHMFSTPDEAYFTASALLILHADVPNDGIKDEGLPTSPFERLDEEVVTEAIVKGKERQIFKQRQPEATVLKEEDYHNDQENAEAQEEREQIEAEMQIFLHAFRLLWEDVNKEVVLENEEAQGGSEARDLARLMEILRLEFEALKDQYAKEAPRAQKAQKAQELTYKMRSFDLIYVQETIEEIQTNRKKRQALIVDGKEADPAEAKEVSAKRETGKLLELRKASPESIMATETQYGEHKAILEELTTSKNKLEALKVEETETGELDEPAEKALENIKVAVEAAGRKAKEAEKNLKTAQKSLIGGKSPPEALEHFPEEFDGYVEEPQEHLREQAREHIHDQVNERSKSLSARQRPPHNRRMAIGFVDTHWFDDEEYLGGEVNFVNLPRRTAPTRLRHSHHVTYNQNGSDIIPAGNRGRHASMYRPGPHDSFGGISIEEDNRYFDALRYQEDTRGGTPIPLTAESLRKASKRGELVSSQSTRSSGSHDESDYRRSRTTGHTTQSSAAHDNITIKVSGQAVVKVSGAQIECDGGEITFSSNRGGAPGSGPPYEHDSAEAKTAAAKTEEVDEPNVKTLAETAATIESADGKEKEKAAEKRAAHLLQGCCLEAERSDRIWPQLEGLFNALPEANRQQLRPLIDEIRSTGLLLREVADLSQVHQDRVPLVLDPLNTVLPCLSRSLRDVVTHYENRKLTKENRWRTMFHEMTNEAGGIQLPQQFLVYNYYLTTIRNLLSRSSNFDPDMMEALRLRIMNLREARGIH
ncbi:hypothetical protein GGI43DRAFT_96601 [Trichoderma evansii]